ncbi:hypothetical protein D1816_22995 [Aquimarina sp. AD10]|uniref:pentapeptide repeat-containing protein n=1 Tax=Aquimarina sp. AD10 TaxID=1714849 RepID=UPI000E4A23F6|nr:pentapeptide repeat-containing protein [Aquimarina sp. AD10]AXT63091.1 hypothetical protein D1816_22995 [Aquimarina sp. AD10]RKM91591.1 hypothetical protein D7033_22045 [Aquimarina sp. AD10]
MEELQKRITDLEKELIEQEHRPIRIVSNYLKRRQYTKDDPRRLATTKAIIWRLLFSPAILATTTGGGLTLATIIFMMIQTELLSDQNSLIKDQNKFFQNQILNSDIQVQREIMYNNEEKYSKNQVIEALLSYIKLKRRINPNDRIIISSLNLRNAKIRYSKLENIDFIDTDFRGSIFSEVSFKGSSFNNCKFYLNFESISQKFTSIKNNKILHFNSKKEYPKKKNTIFIGCNFINTNFHQGNQFGGTIFLNCLMKNSNLYNRRFDDPSATDFRNLYNELNAIIFCSNFPYVNDRTGFVHKNFGSMDSILDGLVDKNQQLDKILNYIESTQPKKFKLVFDSFVKRHKNEEYEDFEIVNLIQSIGDFHNDEYIERWKSEILDNTRIDISERIFQLKYEIEFRIFYLSELHVGIPRSLQKLYWDIGING